MFATFRTHYDPWSKTNQGKVIRDFMWSVLSAAVVSGLLSLAVVLETGEFNLGLFASVFVAGFLTGAGKAIALYVGKYR